MLKPIFSNKLISALNQIQKARDTNKLVVFAGSGVSAPSGIPTWKPFCEKMITALSNPKSLIEEKDPLKLAQLLYNELGDKLYNDFVRSELLYNKTTYNQLHSSVLSLKPAHIVTTNYDDHFDQVINQDSLSYSVVKKDQDLPYSDFHNLVVKMHGDFNELNMVLKEDDYLNYSSNFPLIEGFVKALFTNHTILFIGYSFSDIDLKAILQSVKRILGEHTPPAYIFLPNKISLNEIKYLENKGLVPIHSDLVTFENHREQPFSGKDYEVSSPWSTLFTEEMNTKFDFFEETLAFLKFLADFNEFNFSLSNQSIFQQTINSFKRFEGILSVDKMAIPRIFPFNKYNTICFNNTLYTSNSDIHTLIDTFGDILGFMDGKYVGSVQSSYTEEEMEQINGFIFYLNKAGIYYLRKNAYFDDSKLLIIGSPNTFPEKINKSFLINQYHYSFDFYGLANILESYNLPIYSAWSHDDYIYNLTIAYFYFKFGDFINSWNILEKARQSAKRSSNHIVYFVIIVCLEKLAKHIFQYSPYLNNELKKGVTYDLDKICEGLPVDDDIRIALRAIKNLEHNFSEYAILKDRCQTLEMVTEGIMESFIDENSDFETTMMLISFVVRNTNTNNITDLFSRKDSLNAELLQNFFELSFRKILEDPVENKNTWFSTLTGLIPQYILDGYAINLYYLIEKFDIQQLELTLPQDLSSKIVQLYSKFLKIFDSQSRSKQILGVYDRGYIKNINSNFILIFSIISVEDEYAITIFEYLFIHFNKKQFFDCIEPYALKIYCERYSKLLDKQKVTKLSQRYEFELKL